MKKDKLGVCPKKLLAENTSCSLGELIHQRFLVLGEFDLSPIAREPIHDRIIQVFMNLISNALDALVDMKSHPDLIIQHEHLLLKEESLGYVATT